MKKLTIKDLLRSPSSVLSFKEILLMSRGVKAALLKRRLHYYVKTGQLYSIRRGLYAKDKNYNRYEVATKIFIPAYISFETILAQEGVIFQYYSSIFVATYQSKEIMCDGQNYIFRKIKDTILVNPAGLESKGSYWVATKERAFLDILYLHKDYYFDNLSMIDFDKVFEILPLYNNKRMIQKVHAHFEAFKQEE